MNQLVLPLRLADHAVFASFYEQGNESLVATLRALAGGAQGPDGHGCWLWGAKATGKTHLLQAVCDQVGDRSVYIPLSTFAASLFVSMTSRQLPVTLTGKRRYSVSVTSFSMPAGS